MDLLYRMGNHDHHPEEDHLERYIMKTCADQETEAIEKHLLNCEQCNSRLYEAEEWVALLKSAVPLGPSVPKRAPWRAAIQQFFARPAVLAGCAAMGVAMCTVLLRDPAVQEEQVDLHATRGAPVQTVAQADSKHRILLKVDTEGLSGPMQVLIVDSSGSPVWSHPAIGANPEMKIDRRLTPGLYWVRVNSAEGDHSTLREFGLTVR